jgi:membrane protein implicated in regulation of membrane protease activity
MIFFIGIAMLGAIMLAISAFAGDHDTSGLDSAGDLAHGPGFFSLKTISLFMVGTGLAGALAATYSGGVTFFASLLAVLSGLFLGWVGYLFLKVVYRQQASSLIKDDDLIGLQAHVSVAIPAQGLGQVSCVVKSKRVYQEARSKSGRAIQEGTTVYISDVQNGVVIVQKIDPREREI